MAQRIHVDFISEYNDKFTQDLASEFMETHRLNCHHWDYTFLLWHRKFMNEFWEAIGLERTYAVLTEDIDRELYKQIPKTFVMDQIGQPTFRDDYEKLNSFTASDEAQMRLEISQAMSNIEFAIDLDHEGRNRANDIVSTNNPLQISFYNLSFTSQLEEYHDIIHGETGRGMRDVRTAGGDPCFYLHHTFVDLVFEAWMSANPEIALPISRDHYEATPDLVEDYESYEALEALWNERHYTDADYGHVYRITEPVVRQAVFFAEIKHTENFRRVIMAHNNREIGRFAVFTGLIESCASCARKQSHTGQFLIRDLVPINEIVWNINRRWYTWEDAIEVFASIGMSRPVIVSF